MQSQTRSPKPCFGRARVSDIKLALRRVISIDTMHIDARTRLTLDRHEVPIGLLSRRKPQHRRRRHMVLLREQRQSGFCESVRRGCVSEISMTAHLRGLIRVFAVGHRSLALATLCG